jgi:hypothetical protein
MSDSIFEALRAKALTRIKSNDLLRTTTQVDHITANARCTSCVTPLGNLGSNRAD